jgi:hypothetical protein
VTAQEANTPWHTAVIEWMPTVMSFYLDGTLLMASTKRVPTSMHWVLQTDTQLCCEPSECTSGNVQVYGSPSGSPPRRLANRPLALSGGSGDRHAYRSTATAARSRAGSGSPEESDELRQHRSELARDT